MENLQIQTQAILLALKTQSQALEQLISSAANTSETPPGAAIHFESFDEEKESFKFYKERLENFFELKNLHGNAPETKLCKARVLINALGVKYYQLLSSLTAPDLPSSQPYDKLITLLEKHLCPRSNVHTERHKFLSRTQKPDESVSQYIAALKDLSRTSDWICQDEQCKKPIPSILQAQFIRGLQDVEIREQILQQGDNINFERVVEIALAIEAAKRQNKMYNTTVSDIHQVKEKRTFQLKTRGKKDQKSNRNYKPNKIVEDLGLKDLCLCCGKGNHRAAECRSKHKLKCNGCGKKGHIERVCISSRAAKNRAVKFIEEEDDETIYDEIYEINQVTSSINKPFVIAVKICEKKQAFEIDTGSQMTIISKSDFDRLNLGAKMRQTTIQFRTYTQEIFKPLGVVRVPINYNYIQTYGNLYVVERESPPILGREWIHKLGINLQSSAKIQEDNEAVGTYNIESLNADIFRKYNDIFEPIVGMIPNVECNLRLKEEAKPVYFKPRPVPYALYNKTKEEIDSLICQGILEKTEHSEWGTPLVIVPKPNKSIRICADYKVTVNSQLHDSRYPIPRIEDIFSKQRNGKYFCVLDLHKAYLHLALDSDSQKIATISTPWGTYLVKRLFMGIKTAPNLFHKAIDQILHDLDGTVAYFDDILITGNTLEECYRRLIQCLDRLRAHNLHINKDKCKFFATSIKYLGHKISAQGLEKCPEKVDAILKAPPPKNIDEARSFIGLALYYSRFIPNASSILFPINQLLRKDTKFKWTSACQRSFQIIKNEISSDKVLVSYNPDLPLILATDASPHGLAAVLSHIIDGEERPIYYASRSLTRSESSYSQLDREATAVYWAFKRFYHYLYGRKFTLIIDNKPLERIFHPNKALPIMSAHRLIRYAEFISGFDYQIQHRTSKEHANVDYFSRNPVLLDTKLINFIEDSYQVNQLTISIITESPTITYKKIVQETEQDTTLKTLKNKLLSGEIQNPEFTVHSGIIMRGTRVYIPEKLRPAILKELHQTHIGVVKMKGIARSLCYWPGIDAEIEALVKACQNCAEVKKSPEKAPLHTWQEPEQPWQRIHADYAGPFKDHYFFVVVDAKTKWVEISMSKKAPDTKSTIQALDEIFARNGLPHDLVTDNATNFKSQEFMNFCESNGIQQKFSAPNHPATNGLAERTVQTLKQKLKAMSEEPGSLREKLNAFLFKYRSTPLINGKTPAELHINRKLRTRLHLIQPPVENTRKQEKLPVRKFYPGSRVQARNYSGPVMWKFGTVIKKLGRLHYLVKLDHGYILKRHIDQLRETEVFSITPPVMNKTWKFAPESQSTDGFSEIKKPEDKVYQENVTTEAKLEKMQNNSTGLGEQPPANKKEMQSEAGEASSIQPLRRSQRERKPVDRLIL